MDRKEWLTERSRIAEERMDKLFSATYDENWGEIEKPHKEMIEKLIKNLPPHPYILDAACGTGKYWYILIENNCQVLGVDHSSGMLNQAKRKFPLIQTKKMKLQSLEFTNEFDGVICVDAMENVFPELWTIVLNNFVKALKKEGFLYFTVELLSEQELQENYEESKADGIPVVYGEHIEKGGFGGYHYYPKIQRVKEWIHQSNLEIVAEEQQGVYYHFLTNKK